ncbi:type IX secretion system sortase PorU [Arcicella aquatica]|uniref:Type IX secretion system sortase PorU n=1 Tax=Arcicella aquatica TaxID=217141 RepID=A0ABU5QJ07_9BACT|nr:type IX secretion system sortase PorU [Arcicella aquatica]MEA5257013.1 type IX secretion system sortase PorU [Arcicella aquatica]
MKKSLINSILFFLFFFPLKNYAQNSVLAKGNWIKIGVKNNGVYRLDAEFLQRNGFDLAKINPQNIQLFGNGGGMLPQNNLQDRAVDLTENNIYIEGEADGKFDAQDFILFYGQSPHKTYYDATTGSLKHQFNIYADTTFYFLTLAETKGLRIKDQASVVATNNISTFDDYVFHEVDQKNILAQAPFAGSGREWFGEEFSGTNEQIFAFNLPGIIATSMVNVTCSAAVSAYGQTDFVVRTNEEDLGRMAMSAIGSDRYDYKGASATKSFTISGSAFASTDAFRIGLTYDKKTLTYGVGYLNYLGIQAKRALKLYNQQTIFRAIESVNNPTVNYVIEKPTATFSIWDITNPLQVQNQVYSLQNQSVNFGLTSQILREFIIFSNTDFLVPVSAQKINNQNLHNIDVPNLVIVSSPLLKNQASRLADFRKEHDKLSVLVVSPEEIYNEYSSGKQDISAIRDFLRSLYQKKPDTIKYLLLFGDASYDYKKRLNVINDETKAILIPTYESRESLHPIFSYSSDDYFGFLQDNEGEWTENQAGNHTLEIGIGRLPVKNSEEAKQIVDKLINYGTNKNTIGQWRSKLAFVADDDDGNIHQQDAEAFATMVNIFSPAYQTEKIYLDAFPLVSLPEGQRSPLANNALNQAFQQGSLIVNYNGHGAETGWTDEQILTLKDIQSWTNFNNMPLMLTATCQFGRFDDPNQISGAELSILNPNGGAIALLTTTRPVYQNTNFFINQAFYQAVFTPINGVMPRLGDVMVYTKNNSLQGVLNRNFSLLGDPSMKLAYPEYEVSFVKINGKEIAKADTLKAQSKVTIEGEIRQLGTQTRINTFSGKAVITVYDKEKSISTKGNKGLKFNYQDFTNILFKGEVSVLNGSFTSTFVVPKDINYQLGEGKIFMYAQTTDGLLDASGALNPMIGGADNRLQQDNTPPSAKLYLNDLSFVDGGLTNESPIFLANIADENGINIASEGLGHELLLTVDDTLKIIVNQYFIANKDDYRSGQIKYQIKNLIAGEHQLKLKVWDTNNNSTESSLRFRVNAESQNTLKNVFCFPNPTSEKTTFSFEHNQEGDDFNVIIEIFDTFGHLIKQIKENAYQVSTPFNKISWNIVEDSVSNVTGNYFYRIFVKSLTTGYQANGSGKIISLK